MHTFLKRILFLNQNTSQLAAGMNGSQKNLPEGIPRSLLRGSSFVFFALFFILYSVSMVSAADDTSQNFDITANLSYRVLSNLDTRVSQNIIITNKKEFVYSPAYSVTLHLKNIQDISVQNSNGNIPYTVTDSTGDSKTINMEFPDRILGIGSKNSFTFSYTSSDFAGRTGDIKRITIPSLSNPDAFTNYTATVTVPASFGKPTLLKPPISFASNGNSFTFSKDNLHGSAIELYFGASQLYKFNIIYNLENKNLFPIKTEIAIPPNTTYQEVLLKEIFPKPESTYTDIDGNVLAVYTLPAKSIKKVTADVLINVSDNPTPEALTDTQKTLYLQPQKYWEVNNSDIKKIASTLKTPGAVYDYTVKTLAYNTTKTADQNTRLGAVGVLSKPYFAVCLEFTDLFVALSRAAGIPARAVEGYAYTDNEADKPVSLFKDILHAWPEYYDETKKTWVMVDPTWEDTTGGVDYFHTLDFDHVAFTINGRDSTYPVPAGGYKINPDTQDITVSFPASNEFIKVTNLDVSGSFSSFVHGTTIPGSVVLKNNSNYELAGYNADVFLDGKKSLSVAFPATPPFGQSTVSVSLPLRKQSFISSLTNITHTVTIQNANGKVFSIYTVRAFPFSELLLLGGAALVTTIIIFIIAFKTRSVSVQKRR